MATKEEIAVAVKVINEVAGSPDSGVIADLIKDLEKAGLGSTKVATNEVRIVEAKETR